MSFMILDAGNNIIKAKISRRYRGEISFPHALIILTATEYSRIHSPTYAGTPRFCNWLVGSRPLSITNFHEHNDTEKTPSEQNVSLCFDETNYLGFEDFRYRPYN